MGEERVEIVTCPCRNGWRGGGGGGGESEGPCTQREDCKRKEGLKECHRR